MTPSEGLLKPVVVDLDDGSRVDLPEGWRVAETDGDRRRFLAADDGAEAVIETRILKDGASAAGRGVARAVCEAADALETGGVASGASEIEMFRSGPDRVLRMRFQTPDGALIRWCVVGPVRLRRRWRVGVVDIRLTLDGRITAETAAALELFFADQAHRCRKSMAPIWSKPRGMNRRPRVVGAAACARGASQSRCATG